jgi:hypothetical protein
VLAVQRRGTDLFDWSLTRNYQLKPQDGLLVLATRAGLGQTPGQQPEARSFSRLTTLTA